MLTHPKYVIKYAKLSYFDQMSNNKTAVHIRQGWVSIQAHIQDMQIAVTSAQMAHAKSGNGFVQHAYLLSLP